MDKGINIISLALLSFALLTFNADRVNTQTTTVKYTMLHSAVAKGAVCLDGSPPAYAYSEGYGNGSQSWMIFLEGGAWCVSIEDCYNRSKNHLGSSRLDIEGGVNAAGVQFLGILDSNATFNPYFYNWHKVFIHYCDGAVFMADVKHVDPSTNITFRGGRIYKAMMEEMLNKGMRNAENAILTGSSAGGLSTILHCDEFRNLFPLSSRVKCISDSGFFVKGDGELANLTTRRRFGFVVATHELADQLPKSCTSKRDPNLCLFAEFLVGDVITPLFLVESAFDFYQIKTNFIYTVGIPRPSLFNECLNNLTLCTSTQIGIIKEFRPIFIKTLMKLDNSSSRGMFIDSCYDHTHIVARSKWACSRILRNKTIGQAVADWYFNGTSFREISTHPLPLDCQANDKICRARPSQNGSERILFLVYLILYLFAYVCICISKPKLYGNKHIVTTYKDLLISIN